jgi:hypothetical protein
MEAIKGNIGAIPDFTDRVVFRRNRADQHMVLGGSLDERMIFPYSSTPFTQRPLPAILAKTNFPAT